LVLRGAGRDPNFAAMSLRFVKAFLKSPGSVGALWPSSPFLARAMVAESGISHAEAVLELGPGTGAFTGAILSSLREGAVFAAVERDSSLARTMAGKFPRAKVIEGCATRLGEHLEAESLPRPDVILSGLPWAAFDEDLQKTILGQIRANLRDDGIFTTFAYYGPHRLRAGRRFRKNLESAFRHIHRSPVVLRNLPPAFVYACRV
jgi:phosphatidylethanolamine/phosphatidyl-N-methylethanolamine N-methyltransferase